MQNITLTKPDDWHLHVRDGEAMASVIGHTKKGLSKKVKLKKGSVPF